MKYGVNTSLDLSERTLAMGTLCQHRIFNAAMFLVLFERPFNPLHHLPAALENYYCDRQHVKLTV